MSDKPPQSDAPSSPPPAPLTAPGSTKAPRKAVRPTQAEEQEREDFAYELICRSLLKSVIKAQFRKKFGDLSPRTIEGYLARARTRILAEAQRTKDEMRADSRAFYDAVTRDPQADHRSKLIARERIDRLFGLDAPQKTALTDPTGENPYVGLDRDELIRAILARAAAGGPGQDSPGDGRQDQGEGLNDQVVPIRGTDDESQAG